MAGERRQEILQTAIKIIADEGYASLSMRALARASGMKLGALQYHFRIWEDLLRALVGCIADDIRESWRQRGLDDSPSVSDIAAFMLDETSSPAEGMLSDSLWPQLWAMEQVEPLVSDLLEQVYAEYMEILVEAMEAAGFESPKATSVRLDDETLKRVGRMAEAMDRPRAWLMAHAIKKFIEQEEWFIREVEHGIDAAGEGRLKEHADVKAKWEARRAAAMD